ncbi:hypothetical protein ACFX13_032994 [Malus domestica]
MHLGMLKFDIAFKLTQSTALIEESTSLQKDILQSGKELIKCPFLIIKNALEDHIRGGISIYDLAKEYMAKVEEKFKRSDKVEIGVYLSELINAKYDGVVSIMENLLKLVNLSNKLNAMDIRINDQFLVHMTLFSLSNDYEQIKVSYNIQKATWGINEIDCHLLPR